MRSLVGQELVDIEFELAKACRGLELVCELNLDERDTDHLATGIRQLIETLGPGPATDHLAEKRPHVLAAYLVFEGIRSYTQGDYWTAVCERTGIHKNYTLRWGGTFRRVLERHRLPTFDESGGNVHVTPILLHGGIPTYCLPDFVREFVLPGVARPEFAGLRAGDLLASWRESPRLERGDRPIRRFLLHGGREAEDFLDRSMDFVRVALCEQTPPHPADHGLPERLGQVVADVIERTGSRGPSSRASLAVTRREAPRLVLDPWGVGVTLLLPEQAIEGRAARWEVVIDGRDPLRHTPRTWRGQGSLRIEADSIRPAAPFRYLRVQLVVDEQPSGAPWTVEGLVPELPILAFDEQRQESTSTRRLEPRPTWFVLPRDARLDGGKAVCAAVRLPGAWSDLEARCLDLAGAQRLRFARAGRTIDLPVLSETTRVHIRGEEIVGLSTTARGRVFGGGPIEVRYGGVRGRANLRIFPEPGASLASPLSVEADGPQENEDHVVRLDLAGLGGAFGTFVAVLRGALGHSCRLEFAIVPKLTVEFGTTGGAHALLRCPDVAVRVDDGGHLETHRGAHRLAFAPDRREANVTLTRGLDSVSLRVPNPAPRWALVGMDEATEVVTWHTRALETDREQLERSHSPALVVEWPVDRGTNPRLGLERAGEVVQVVEANRLDRIVRFDLTPVRPNLERRHGGHARLLLEPGAHEVVRVRSAWSPRNVQVDAYLEGEATRIVTSWSSDDTAPGREIVLFDLQRPWRSPVIVAISDGDSSRCALNLNAGTLRGGPMRAWLRLRDPWAADPQPWDVPPPGGGGVTEFRAPALDTVAEPQSPVSAALQCIEEALASPDARTALGVLGGLPQVPVEDFSRAVEILAVLDRYPSTDTIHHHVRRRLRELVHASHRPFLVALARLGERLPVEALRSLAWHEDLGQRIATRHLTPYVSKVDGDKALVRASDELSAKEVQALLEAPSEPDRVSDQLTDAELDALGRISPALCVFLEAARPSNEAAATRRRLERLLGETAVRDLQPLRARTLVAVGDVHVLVEAIHVGGLGVDAALLGRIPPFGLVLTGKRVPTMTPARVEVLRTGSTLVQLGEEVPQERDAVRLDLNQSFPKEAYSCWAETWRPAFEALSDGAQADFSAVGGGGWALAGGLLDAEGVTKAVRSALEAVAALDKKRRQAVKAQLCDASPLLDRAVQLNARRLPAPLVSALRTRRRPEASRFWLMHLPAVSLAAAAVQRLFARREAQEGCMRPQQLVELVRTLSEIAPALLERDLCLAELAIAWFQETRP